MDDSRSIACYRLSHLTLHTILGDFHELLKKLRGSFCESCSHYPGESKSVRVRLAVQYTAIKLPLRWYDHNYHFELYKMGARVV